MSMRPSPDQRRSNALIELIKQEHQQKIASKEATIKQLQEENKRLKGLLKEWIDQFGYPDKSLTNDTLDAIKQKP